MTSGWNFGFKKKRDCIICVVTTKALISGAVIAQLICTVVFTYANRFSHNAAHLTFLQPKLQKGNKQCLFDNPRTVMVNKENDIRIQRP